MILQGFHYLVSPLLPPLFVCMWIERRSGIIKHKTKKATRKQKKQGKDGHEQMDVVLRSIILNIFEYFEFTGIFVTTDCRQPCFIGNLSVCLLHSPILVVVFAPSNVFSK